MNGDWLALGAMGVLAAAGLSRRGSRDVVAAPYTVTREGWPWPSDYPLFHATTGLRAIQRQRFRTRAQGLQSMLGGGTDEAISFTLSRSVANAVLVGLVVLRQGARRELSLVDLWEAFARECPKGMAKLRAADDVEHSLERARRLDRHLFREEVSFGEPLPSGAQALDKGWAGRDEWMHRQWLREPATQQQRAKIQEDWDYAFRELYNALTMYGSSERECYYPSFWSTNMRALAELSIEDLGLIQATSSVPRICMGARGAIQFGYLDHGQAQMHEGFLNRLGRDCRRGPDYEESRYDPMPMFAGWGGPLENQIGPWHFVDEGNPVKASSMVVMDSMFEVRVYDPTKLEVAWAQSAEPYLDAQGLSGRVSAPWASDDTLAGGRVLPGAVLRQRVS